MQEPNNSDQDGLVALILRNHFNKPALESQHLVATTLAIAEVLQGEGLQPTPTALFVATLATLEKAHAGQDGNVTEASCRLLSMVLPRVPNTVIRNKSTQCLGVLCSNAEHDKQVRWVLAAIPSVLVALHPQEDWPVAVRAFSLLTQHSLNSKPKVRKLAQSGLESVLAAWSTHPAAARQHSSQAMLQASTHILQAPEKAAKAAAAASKANRTAAETAITDSVTDALHWLGALERCARFVEPSMQSTLGQLLFALFPLQQPLLTRHALDVLVASAGSCKKATVLQELLIALLQQSKLLQHKDLNIVLSSVQLVAEVQLSLQEADPVQAASSLPSVIRALMSVLLSDSDATRQSAAMKLQQVLRACLTPALVSAAVAAQEAGAMRTDGHTTVVQVVAALADMLDPTFQEGWVSAMKGGVTQRDGTAVLGALWEQLGAQGAPLAGGPLQQLGDLCAGAYAAAGDGGTENGGVLHAAESCMGAALQHVGPAYVLQVLPLGVEKALAGEGEARTWLLPLLRKHVRGASLQTWCSSLLPLARALGSRAAAAASTPSRKAEAIACRSLELQLWNCLPAFCRWPSDGGAALQDNMETLGTAFHKRTELRTPIMVALRTLCVQTRLASKEHGHVLGYGRLAAAVADDDAASDVASQAGDEEEAVPPHFTYAVATAQLQALQAYAQRWLNMLFTMFVTAQQAQTSEVGRTIAALAAVTPEPQLQAMYKEVLARLVKTLQGQQQEGDGKTVPLGDSNAQCCRFMELAVACAPGLGDSDMTLLYKAALPGLQSREPAVQKKSYKLLAYLCEERPGFVNENASSILDALLAGLATAQSAAKRFRLRCLKVAVMLAQDGRTVLGDAAQAIGAHDEVAASLVSEVVLSVKESNLKSRVAAYDLLVQLANEMEARQPSAGLLLHDGPPQGGLYRLMTMVLGGVVGSTPSMMSASVMALARLLYEFPKQLSQFVPRLLPPVLAMLRSKSREVIKAVLGFVKVAVIRTPEDALQPFIPDILTGILLWAEDSKNRFKAKVRMIVERLARRFGFDALSQHMPEAHAKLLTHIRKEKSRERRRRDQQDGDEDEMDVDGDDAMTARSGRRSSKSSKWAHTAVFGAEDADDRGGTIRSGSKVSFKTKGRAKSTAGAKGHRLPGDDEGEVVDLLDPSTSRRMLQATSGKRRKRAAGGSDEERDMYVDEATGKLVVLDLEANGTAQGKRKRGEDGYHSDDSDFGDLKNMGGAREAWRSTKDAKSVKYAATQASRGRMSMGGRSNTSNRSGRSALAKGSSHSGERFKSKKGAGGDVKGKSKVEPYAYWKMDRKMLNRRANKRTGARKGLENIVAAAQKGAAKGSKAKKQRKG